MEVCDDELDDLHKLQLELDKLEHQCLLRHLAAQQRLIVRMQPMNFFEKNIF